MRNGSLDGSVSRYTPSLSNFRFTIVCGVAVQCMPSLSKYFSVTRSSDTLMSPAIGDIDLMGFYPSLSRDGAVVSGKPSDSNASVALITAEAFGQNINQSF